MEFFLPSVLILLLAAAVVFFVVPNFGPAVLAVVSAALLALGLYHHRSTFGAEYRLSSWSIPLMSYAPYIMIGGLLLFIAIYLLYLLPASSSNATAASMPPLPTISAMPPANTATNPVTSAINVGLNSVVNNKKNNTGGILGTLTGNVKKNNKGSSIPFSQV
jgi:hypothetical protein